jgi:hypothetical protein
MLRSLELETDTPPLNDRQLYSMAKRHMQPVHWVQNYWVKVYFAENEIHSFYLAENEIHTFYLAKR